MSLTKTFNARVIYQLHSNPPIFGLYSEELGYSEIALHELNLSQSDITALGKAHEVSGTCVLLEKPYTRTITAPGKTREEPWSQQPVTWIVTSITPKI